MCYMNHNEPQRRSKGLNVLHEPQRTTTKVKSREGGWGFYKQGYGHGFAASSMYMYKNDVGKKFMK